MPVALALGGGAALGWSHIGVLQVLEEEGIAIGAVAGTSIGALVALCYASGQLKVLEEVAMAFTRRNFLSYFDIRLAGGALIGGARIEALLHEHFGDLRLEDLPLPTTLVASDLASVAEVRLCAGPAVPAVRASMALPGIFRPVEVDGRLLMDGGCFAVVPLGAARALAPDLPLVAVDLVSDYAGLKEPPRNWRAAMRAAFLMTMSQQIRQAARLDPADVFIRVPVSHMNPGSFHRAAEFIAIGRAAAIAALPAIRAAMLPKN